MNKNKFLKDFYNNRFLRQCIYDKLTTNNKYYTNIPLLNKRVGKEYNNTIYKFILKYSSIKKAYGDLYIENSYFKNFIDYKENDESERYINNIFFDFDVQDNIFTKLKKRISYIFSHTNIDRVERYKQINSLRDEYLKALKQSVSLVECVEEVQKVTDFLEDDGVKTLVSFSGSKGFHVYLLFNQELQFQNYKDISLSFYHLFKNNFNLKYIDLAVHDKGLRQKDRVLYSKHSVSNLYSCIIDIDFDSVDDILDKAISGKVPSGFKKDNYVIKNNEFYIELSDLDDYFTRVNNEHARWFLIKQKKDEILNKRKQKTYKFKPNININPDDLKMYIKNCWMDGNTDYFRYPLICLLLKNEWDTNRIEDLFTEIDNEMGINSLHEIKGQIRYYSKQDINKIAGFKALEQWLLQNKGKITDFDETYNFFKNMFTYRKIHHNSGY